MSTVSVNDSYVLSPSASLTPQNFEIHTDVPRNLRLYKLVKHKRDREYNNNYSDVKDFAPFNTTKPSDAWMTYETGALVRYIMTALADSQPQCVHVFGILNIMMNKDNTVTGMTYRSFDPLVFETLYKKQLFDKYTPETLSYKFLKADVQRYIEEGYSYVAVDVSVIWEGKEVGHANTMFIDAKRKIVEYYEPHGYSRWLLNCLVAVSRVFPDYTVTSPSVKCPRRQGPQRLVREYDQGWCKTFAALYIIYRVLNPEANPDKIARYIARGTPEGHQRQDTESPGICSQAS